MKTFDEDTEHLIASAAEFGHTREQVLGWTRADLIRFGDELTARVEIEQAGLAAARDICRELYGQD